MLFKLGDWEKWEAGQTWLLGAKGRKGRFKCNSATNRDFIGFPAYLMKCNQVQRSATAQHAAVRSRHWRAGGWLGWRASRPPTSRALCARSLRAKIASGDFYALRSPASGGRKA